MDQQLYELPDEWDWKCFSEICDNITDGAHASPKTVDEGKPYVTVRDVNAQGEIDLITCKKISDKDFKSLTKANCSPFSGDVLLSKDGTVGKVALVKENYIQFVVLSSLAIIRPNKNILNSEFLKNFLLSPGFQEYAINSKTGAAIKRIVLRNIKSFQIPLPPLSEQKRIVEKLDALISRIDQAVNHLQESLGLAEALFASSLDGAFNPLGSTKNPEGIYELPDGWEWKTIEEVFSITSGKNLTKKDMNEEGKYPVFGGNGIAGYFNDYNLKGVNIIIGRVGALCGNVRLIIDPIWITDNAFYIKLSPPLHFNSNLY